LHLNKLWKQKVHKSQVKRLKIDICIFYTGYCNNLKVLYSCAGKTTLPKGTIQRLIPQQPERILDAPELFDDYCKFYYTIVDFWGGQYFIFLVNISIIFTTLELHDCFIIYRPVKKWQFNICNNNANKIVIPKICFLILKRISFVNTFQQNILIIHVVSFYTPARRESVGI
jgi:hypothetical protein